MSFNRGAITLVFDDGYQKIYQDVVPLLDRYNIKAVFALPLETPPATTPLQATLKPWSQWLHLRQQGHEIAAHGISHTDLTRLTDSELIPELEQPRIELAATTLIYPGGAVNDHVANVAKQYYQAARSTNHGFEKLSPPNPMQLKTFNFRKGNFSVPKANFLALYAFITNSWLIETYHIVDDKETKAIHTVKLSQFKRHLSFLAKLPLIKTTIHKMITPSPL